MHNCDVDHLVTKREDEFLIEKNTRNVLNVYKKEKESFSVTLIMSHKA